MKVVSFEADFAVGDTCYYIEEPDFYEEGIMEFVVSTDMIRIVGISEDGVRYFTDGENEVCPEKLTFLYREEAEAFIAEYCQEFNNAGLMHGMPIYTRNGTEHLKSANIDDMGHIILHTKTQNHYRWEEREHTFSLKPRKHEGSAAYAVMLTKTQNDILVFSNVEAVFSRQEDARKYLDHIKNQPYDENDIFFSGEDSFSYRYTGCFPYVKVQYQIITADYA